MKTKVKLIGEDGNVFNLVGIISKEMRRNGQCELASEMSDKVFKSESYDEAFAIIMEYVDVE